MTDDESDGRPATEGDVADLPTSVQEIPTEEAEEAIYDHLYETIVSAERRSQTVAAAADLGQVATLGELRDAADREKGQIPGNETPEAMDEAGFGLRIPAVSDTSFRDHLFGFRPRRREYFESVAQTDPRDRLSRPRDERTRRALRYAGAELVAYRRVADQEEADGEEPSGRSEPDADPEPAELAAMFDDLADTEEIDDVLDDFGVDSDEFRAALRAASRQKNLDAERERIDAGSDGDGEDDVAESSDSGEEESVPDPEEGVLGHDWVRTADRPWSGRPLRSHVYALVAGLLAGRTDSAVDRVELVNYGEPAVGRGERGLPREFDVVWDRARYDGRRHEHEYALDLRVPGEFRTLPPSDERELTDLLHEQVLNLHVLARYDDEMRDDERSTEAAEETAPRADGGPDEQLPPGLVEARDDLFGALQYDEGVGPNGWQTHPEYDATVRVLDDAIHVSSYQQTKG